MPIMRIARPATVGILATLLLTVVGCSKSAEKPTEQRPPASPSKESPEVDAAPVKLPVAEFQQPPVAPPSPSLPKPSPEPLEQPSEPRLEAADTTPAEPRQDTAKTQPGESTNPLRDAAAPSKQPASQIAKDEMEPLPGRPRSGKNSGQPFDPIKENGTIFKDTNSKDWPKPKVAMIITGMEHGYLEPCGCAGLDRMKGGMTRRATLFKELREKGWPVVGLDVGGLVQGFGRQAELKFQTLVEGKKKMRYDAVAFGTDDLRLPAAELLAAAASVDDTPSIFVAANVGLFGLDQSYTSKFRVIEAGGMKIGVTAVLGKSYQKEIRNDEIEMIDADAALEKIVPELKQKADYLVLLAHATTEETKALGKKFPAFNVIITSDGNPEPPRDIDGRPPQTIEGTKTPLITVGYKGMNAIVLGLFDDAANPVRYQRVPLDSRFPASPDMKLLMVAYQEQVKIAGFAGLGLRPVPHPQLETNGRFIGSEKCESCHEKSNKIWKKTGHGHAYDTIAKLDPPRNFDPECVSCHVVGWHPTNFFPYVSGYESQEKTPLLIDTGCEGCHGPGEKHAAAEIGADEELQMKLRKAVVVTKAEAKKQMCLSCHDLDNSPDFDFDLYWPHVRHYEMEEE